MLCSSSSCMSLTVFILQANKYGVPRICFINKMDRTVVMNSSRCSQLLYHNYSMMIDIFDISSVTIDLPFNSKKGADFYRAVEMIKSNLNSVGGDVLHRVDGY